MLTLLSLFNHSRVEVVKNEAVSSAEEGYFEVEQCTVDTLAVGWSFLFIGGQLLWGAKMAIFVRHVPSSFNESQHIMFSLLLMLVYAIIIVPLVVLIGNRPNESALLVSLGTSLGVILFTAILFGPKLVAITTGQANRVHRGATTSHRDCDDDDFVKNTDQTGVEYQPKSDRYSMLFSSHIQGEPTRPLSTSHSRYIMRSHNSRTLLGPNSHARASGGSRTIRVHPAPAR